MKKLSAQLGQFLRNPFLWVFLVVVGGSAFIVGRDFCQPAPGVTSRICGDFAVCSHDAAVLTSTQAAGLTVSDTLLPETSKPYILIEKNWVPERNSVCVTKATLQGYYLTDVHERLHKLSSLQAIDVDTDDPSMRAWIQFRAPHLLNHDESGGEPKRPISRFSHGDLLTPLIDRSYCWQQVPF
jgi:hypothetical protein